MMEVILSSETYHIPEDGILPELFITIAVRTSNPTYALPVLL
jgi:hypothetical protein